VFREQKIISETPARIGALRGAPAPDFALKTLDGKTLSYPICAAKLSWVNFWATWCAPCKIETPWIVDLQNQYGAQGLQVVGVSMDDESDTRIFKKFATMHMELPHPGGTEDVGNFLWRAGIFADHLLRRKGWNVTGRVLGLKGRGDMEEM